MNAAEPVLNLAINGYRHHERSKRTSAAAFAMTAFSAAGWGQEDVPRTKVRVDDFRRDHNRIVVVREIGDERMWSAALHIASIVRTNLDEPAKLNISANCELAVERVVALARRSIRLGCHHPVELPPDRYQY